MESLHSINDPGDLFRFLLWSLALYGVSKALFRSFMAAEARVSLRKKEGPHLALISKTRWELKNNSHFDEKLAGGDNLRTAIPLNEAQREGKAQLMDTLRRRTQPYRALNWFFDCAFCQVYWLALIIGAFSWHGFGDWIGSAFAHATLALFYTRLLSIGTPPKEVERGGCPSCG